MSHLLRAFGIAEGSSFKWVFMTQALKMIWDNIRDLYIKRLVCLLAKMFSTHISSQAKICFTEQFFFPGIQKLDQTPYWSGGCWSSKRVEQHHEVMINDTNFSSTFATWKSHNRNLWTSFFNAPYLLDMHSRSYVKGFNHEWMTSKCLQIVRSIPILLQDLVPLD